MTFTPPEHTTTANNLVLDTIDPADRATYPGINLRIRRESLGLSARDFADYLNIGLRTAQRWEAHSVPGWALLELDAIIDETHEWIDEILTATTPIDVWHDGWHITRAGRTLPASWWRVTVGRAMMQSPVVDARWAD